MANRTQLINKTLSELVGECGDQFMDMRSGQSWRAGYKPFKCDRPVGHDGRHTALRYNEELKKDVRFYWKHGFPKIDYTKL